MSKPGLVAVTGMHRGGTSVVARAVNLLGISVGDPGRLMPATPDNPGGYWENLRVAQMHDELMGVLGGWWAGPPDLPEHWQWDPCLSPFQTWIAQIIQDHYEPYGRCLVKDPRLCFLLPLWRVLTTVHPVVVGVRDPAEVVSSLTKRDGLAPEIGAWLWLRHMDAIGRVDPDALVIDYADWFTRPDDVIDRLVAHLDVPPPDAAVRASITDWVRPELRRSAAHGGSDGPFFRAALDAHAVLVEEGLSALLKRADDLLPEEWRAAPPGRPRHP